jgi:pimeloyl-ACP methyl ester carboxylesterase
VRRTPLAVLVVVALVVAGCTGDSGSRLPERASPRTGEAAGVSWQPCPEVPEEALAGLVPAEVVQDFVQGITYECATVSVPQDWDAQQAPESFAIALVRARSDAQQDRIGSLVINPGGPGASGVDFAVYLSLASEFGGLPEEVTRRFDVIGFDPRGVSRSSPVECHTDADLDEKYGAEPDPATQEEFDAAVADIRRVAEACGEKYGEALNYFSTRQTAHDMDAVRAAVGDEQITYLGFSYGTLLGAVYAQLYPERIRAMVLDGAVDPEQDEVAGSESQAAGFERAFGNFADWCDATPAQCPLGPDTRAAVTGAIDAARRSPVPGADGREATAGWVMWSVIASLYLRDQWPELGDAIDELAQGDPGGVFELADNYTGRDADGQYPNLDDMLTAVNCVDNDSEVTVEQARDLQQQWREEYPLFGAPLAMSTLGCGLWPAESDPYPTGPAEGAPPIVVVGTTGDPATPFEATARLAEMLGVGVVLTWEGEGHTAYRKTGCINEAVNAYLIELTTPAEGTTCPPD